MQPELPFWAYVLHTSRDEHCCHAYKSKMERWCRAGANTEEEVLAEITVQSQPKGPAGCAQIPQGWVGPPMFDIARLLNRNLAAYAKQAH